MPRKSSRESILDAAERVILRQGLAAATMEAVASEAGLSKGGLFYHFASKKEMLQEIVERYRRHFKALRQEIHDALPDTPGRLLKATILASIRHPMKNRNNISNLISLLDDTGLREAVAKLKEDLFREVSAGAKKPEQVALAMLAADGLWVVDMFGGGLFSADFQQKIIDELMRIVDEFGSERTRGKKS